MIRGIIGLLLGLFGSSMGLAHGEHFTFSTKPARLQLSAEQIKWIDLKTTLVQSKALAKGLHLNGEMQLLPNAQADVSLRISGNITELYANLGDKVRAGQPLLKVQSLLIGDPPPSVIKNAPMSGIIDKRNAYLGQAVAPNTILFHISDRSKMILLAKVYEEDVGKVKLGQEVEVRTLSYPNQPFTGKVSLIEPNLDALTRTINIQVLLDNSQDLLKPGMFARAFLILERKNQALVIPTTAIIEASQGKLVFKRLSNAFLPISVKTGIESGEWTEISEGLALGDEVVTQGNRQLYTYWLTGGQPQANEEHD